jgi:hypothetical protein
MYAKNWLTFSSPLVTWWTNRFNIQELYALPTLYSCVLYLSENKQRLHFVGNKQKNFYNRVEKCLQRGTDSVFKESSLRLVFQRLIKGLFMEILVKVNVKISLRNLNCLETCDKYNRRKLHTHDIGWRLNSPYGHFEWRRLFRLHLLWHAHWEIWKNRFIDWAC